MNRGQRGSVIVTALATLVANAVVFGTLLAISIENSQQTNAPLSEIARKWAPAISCPIIATLTATAIAALPIARKTRIGLAGLVLAAAIYGLLGTFDTGDGVCTHQLTTLTGTVRGDCFQQPKMIAATLWSIAATALALLAVNRPKSPKAA